MSSPQEPDCKIFYDELTGCPRSMMKWPTTHSRPDECNGLLLTFDLQREKTFLYTMYSLQMGPQQLRGVAIKPSGQHHQALRQLLEV